MREEEEDEKGKCPPMAKVGFATEDKTPFTNVK
jgi:hypothetical protein